MDTASTEPTLSTLVRRLDHLEKSLRRWRVLGSAAWILLAAGLDVDVEDDPVLHASPPVSAAAPRGDRPSAS